MTALENLIAYVVDGDIDSIENLPVDTNLDVQHETYGTPLMMAVATQQTLIATLLLQLGASPHPHHGPTSMTALHIAAANGGLANVEALLESGASVEVRDNQGWTPLMFTVQEGHLEGTRTLLDAGADVDAADTRGRTALMLAANVGNVSAAELLIQHSTDVNKMSGSVTALILAASSGSVPIVDLLVEHGAHVDSIDLKEGYSALMMACYFGNLRVIERLLEAGADVNLETEWFVTARTMARRGGHDDIESMLVDQGAQEPRPVQPPVHFPWGLVGDPTLCKSFQL